MGTLALLGDGYNLLGIGSDPQRTLSLRGTDLIAPLVKAVQEQEAVIERQEADIRAQDAAIETLRAKVAGDDALRARVDELASQVRRLLTTNRAVPLVAAAGD